MFAHKSGQSQQTQTSQSTNQKVANIKVQPMLSAGKHQDWFTDCICLLFFGKGCCQVHIAVVNQALQAIESSRFALFYTRFLFYLGLIYPPLWQSWTALQPRSLGSQNPKTHCLRANKRTSEAISQKSFVLCTPWLAERNSILIRQGEWVKRFQVFHPVWLEETVF